MKTTGVHENSCKLIQYHSENSSKMFKTPLFPELSGGKHNQSVKRFHGTLLACPNRVQPSSATSVPMRKSRVPRSAHPVFPRPTRHLDFPRLAKSGKAYPNRRLSKQNVKDDVAGIMYNCFQPPAYGARNSIAPAHVVLHGPTGPLRTATRGAAPSTRNPPRSTTHHCEPEFRE